MNQVVVSLLFLLMACILPNNFDALRLMDLYVALSIFCTLVPLLIYSDYVKMKNDAGKDDEWIASLFSTNELKIQEFHDNPAKSNLTNAITLPRNGTYSGPSSSRKGTSRHTYHTM